MAPPRRRHSAFLGLVVAAPLLITLAGGIEQAVGSEHVLQALFVEVLLFCGLGWTERQRLRLSRRGEIARLEQERAVVAVY